ncbi:MAG: cytidylate kinase-like family protein [Desulfobacterales bacterium]
MKKEKPAVTLVPWSHGRRRKNITEMTDHCMREWENRHMKKQSLPKMPPTICFSRPIGCGVMNIADILAKKINYRVVDREILEYVAGKTPLSSKAIKFFNEQYPDFITQYLMMIGSEKPFVTSDNIKLLFSAIIAIANLSPTIFIGRGAYLLLPRERTLSVRFICGKNRRVKQIAGIYDIKEAEADKMLKMIDSEQHDFFKVVYQIKEINPKDFDMVINCDFITEPAWAADIVEAAFINKFGSELGHR